MQRRFVVDRYLFTGRNVAQGHEEDVIVENLHVAVRLTRMVDVMSAVPASAAIETPALVDCTDS